MDKIVKMAINDLFIKHFSHVYKSKPELKSVDNTNYYYLTNKDSNIICLLPLDLGTDI